MHSSALPSHQRGMYLTWYPSPQGTVLSVLLFRSLPCCFARFACFAPLPHGAPTSTRWRCQFNCLLLLAFTLILIHIIGRK